MRIELLGRVRAFGDDGKAVEIRGALLRGLLARLALASGRAVQRDRLVDDLWGADPPADAANASQALVFRLRRTLGGAWRVESASVVTGWAYMMWTLFSSRICSRAAATR
ncbi:winged helix-turn-helix domain-containing protein [Nonomuraea endophytica]|uniref:winged helix-turn-helix domain-containing protein n=1 Tax=Nonomuraea endophytica TaxID=714136 RepID=UPI0037C5BBE5